MNILPTAYLPPLTWFQQWMQGEACIEVMETYPKQTFRNRCQLPLPAGGTLQLTVPVIGSERHQLTRDVRISYQQHWQHQHWMALVSTYKHTPYFDYYQDFFRPLYERETNYLVDLNNEFIDVILHLIHNQQPIDHHQESVAAIQRSVNWSGMTWTDTHPWQTESSVVGMLFESGPNILNLMDVRKG